MTWSTRTARSIRCRHRPPAEARYWVTLLQKRVAYYTGAHTPTGGGGGGGGGRGGGSSTPPNVGDASPMARAGADDACSPAIRRLSGGGGRSGSEGATSGGGAGRRGSQMSSLAVAAATAVAAAMGATGEVSDDEGTTPGRVTRSASVVDDTDAAELPPLKGTLYKKNSKGKWDQRFFVATNYFLDYFTSTARAQVIQSFDLTLVTGVTLVDLGEATFDLNFRDGSAANLRAINGAEAKRWVELLRQRVTYYATDLVVRMGGVLLKQGRRRKAWASRWFSLLSDRIVYRGTPGGGVRGEIPLSDETLVDLSELQPFCFTIGEPGGRARLLKAADAAGRELWMGAIAKNISMLGSKRSMHTLLPLQHVRREGFIMKRGHVNPGWRMRRCVTRGWRQGDRVTVSCAHAHILRRFVLNGKVLSYFKGSRRKGVVELTTGTAVRA